MYKSHKALNQHNAKSLSGIPGKVSLDFKSRPTVFQTVDDGLAAPITISGNRKRFPRIKRSNN